MTTDERIRFLVTRIEQYRAQADIFDEVPAAAQDSKHRGPWVNPWRGLQRGAERALERLRKEAP